MAGGKSTARTKKASSAKAATKSSRTAKAAKPAASRARAKTVARAKPAPAKRTARAPAPKAPARKAPAAKTTAAKASARTVGSAIDKLQQVALTATDLDASVDFYRDILGLKFITRFDPPGLAFFSLGGGIRLLLSATASQASLYFQCDDVDAAFKELKGRGVHFLQQPQLIQRDEAGDFGKKGSEEWMAFFNDPAGNLLALVERR